jgi:hypothetical protein
MFQELKVAIYNIKVNPPKVPKTAPDHDLHILLIVVGLNHFPVL